MARLWAPRETTDLAPAPAPAATADGLRLVTYPLLIDEGRMRGDVPELARALEDAAAAELHPDDAAPLDLADGQTVMVRTAAGEARLPLRVTPNIAPGTVFVPWNNPGLAANTLLDGAWTTPVTLEGAEAPEPVAVGEDAS
jgi:anaerobic selenocysteine-containing dehydrogenase